MKNKNNFKIEELLLEIPGWKAEFARFMKISHTGLNTFLWNGGKTPKAQKRYTKAFNECFDTNYTSSDLFNK